MTPQSHSSLLQAAPLAAGQAWHCCGCSRAGCPRRSCGFGSSRFWSGLLVRIRDSTSAHPACRHTCFLKVINKHTVTSSTVKPLLEPILRTITRISFGAKNFVTYSTDHSFRRSFSFPVKNLLKNYVAAQRRFYRYCIKHGVAHSYFKF